MAGSTDPAGSSLPQDPAARLVALLEQQRTLLRESSEDVAPRLDRIAAAIGHTIDSLRAPNTRIDPATATAIRAALRDNQVLLARLSDANRRALQTFFGEPPSYRP